MKKNLLILISTLFVGCLLFFLILMSPIKNMLPQSAQDALSSTFPDYFAGNRSAVSPNTRYSNTSASSTPQIEGWSLQSQDGSTVTVAPFTQKSTTTPSGSSAGSVKPPRTPPTSNVNIVGSEYPLTPYIITYVASDQSFNIGLFKEPLGEVRKQAEKEFLTVLNITEDQACRLKHIVVTPYWVSSFYAGKNLGFSFCPGATQF